MSTVWARRSTRPRPAPGAWASLLLALLLGVWSCIAVASQPVPELRARVMDQTGTLDGAQLARLEERLARFEQERGTQVVVLMLDSTAPEEIAQYTQRLGDAWKIGRRDVGDGLLFVIAKNDRRMRIAPAKALEGAIPDILARRILDEVVAPAFRANDYAGGIEGALDQLLARIEGEALPLPGDARVEDGSVPWPDLLIFLVFAVPLFAAVLREIFGKKLGTLLTGAAAGALAWHLTFVLWIAVGAGLLGMLAALFLQQLPQAPAGGGRGDGRNGHWGGHGGAWGSGGGSGGFGSGGGGNFGGGGASGGW